MNSKIHVRLNLLPRLAGFFSILIFIFAAATSPASGPSGSFTTTNLEIRLYPENSLEPDAVWKIDNILTDHRHLGFFRVQLLPVLVVQGIHLEFTKTNPPAGWLEGFRCEWVPAENRSTLEWRDFTISFPREKIPRVQAGRAHPVANAGSLICRLQGVVLQTGSGQIRLPRADVRMEGQAGKIVWQDAGASVQWDLFSGQFTTNAIVQRTQNEKL
jgi:hypothetical protein